MEGWKGRGRDRGKRWRGEGRMDRRNGSGKRMKGRDRGKREGRDEGEGWKRKKERRKAVGGGKGESTLESSPPPCPYLLRETGADRVFRVAKGRALKDSRWELQNFLQKLVKLAKDQQTIGI